MVSCKNNNIILMGFMGVGKGSLARELLKLSNYMAIDTDDIIESMENTSIKKIFEKEGEAYFREAETKVSLWLEHSVKNTIISIGGGFYHVDNLKNIGHVIYLESSFDAIVDRIKSSKNPEKKFKKRPLLQDMAKAKALINERHPKYLTYADTVIQTAGKKSSLIAEEIMQLLEL
ncbi:MAG TPA: shikimate kinase [Sulfurimonas sp.]|nr:shikimate kinase [Sulfurimonas sp.]